MKNEPDTPQRYILERDAIRGAFYELLRNTLTEPLTILQVSDLFDIERKTAAAFLRNTPGAVRMGRFWRIPLKQVPPAYFMERGLMPIAE